MRDRYDKQRRFGPIGDDGQDAIAAAHIVVVGCGALGALAAEQLVRAGVGQLTLIDRDFVERSNLQRQVLFTEADADEGQPKAVAAATALARVNSEIGITPHVRDITRDSCRELIGQSATVVVDGTDNLETRYLLNEHCLDLNIPWVYGGCVGSTGQATLFFPPATPCLRCLFPDLPAPGELETCDSAGVIAPAAHLVSSLEVALTLRAIVESPEAAGGRLLIADVWEGSMRSVSLPPGDGCPTCLGDERPFLTGALGGGAAVLCGRNAVQLSSSPGARVSLDELAEKLKPSAEVTTNRFLLRAALHDVSEVTLTAFADGRIIVQGTEDPVVARSIVAKYIGS